MGVSCHVKNQQLLQPHTFALSSVFLISYESTKAASIGIFSLCLAFSTLRSTCTVAPVGTRLKVGEGGGRGEKSPDSFEKKVLLSLTCGCQDERQPRKLALAVFRNCKSSFQKIKQHLLLKSPCTLVPPYMTSFTPGLWAYSEKFEKTLKHLPKVASRDN